MEFIDFNKELYSTELFSQLSKAYDKRCDELSVGFSMAIKKIEESEILKEMGGVQLMEYRMEHISEITRQVFVAEQEMQMEQYLRNVSELKAQLAIERKKYELMGKKNQDMNCVNVKQYEDEINSLKRQLVSQMNPQNYEPKTHKHEEALMLKYEQVLQIERKKSQQVLKDHKQTMKMTIQSLSIENQNLKAMSLRLNQQNKNLLSKLQSMSITQPPKISINHSASLKQLSNNNFAQLQHFNPRSKKQVPYIYQMSVQEHPIQQSKTKVFDQTKNSFAKIGRQTFGLKQSAQSCLQKRAIQVPTRFDQIKNSFAKQLSYLRTKMSDNKDKLHSSELRRYSRVPFTRDSSVRKRYQSPSRFTPQKYSIKPYHRC